MVGPLLLPALAPNLGMPQLVIKLLAMALPREECLVLLYTSATWALKLHHFKNFLNIMMNFRRSCFAPTITYRACPSELELRALFAEKHITLRALYCIRGHDELAKLAKEVQLVAGRTKSGLNHGCVQSTLLRT